MSHKWAPLSSAIKGFILGILLLSFLLAFAEATPAYASSSSWNMGVYYKYSGSGGNDFAVNLYNGNLPGGPWYNVPTYTVLSATSNNYFAQIAIGVYTNILGLRTAEIYDYLGTITPAQEIFFDGYQHGGLTENWHTIELQVYYSGSNNVILSWNFDGTTYNTYQIGKGSASFDKEVVPSYNVESYDYTTSDFNNAMTYGTFLSSGVAQNTYLYGGGSGLNVGCTAPQTTGVYVGGGGTPVNNIGVTGHVWGGYGGSHEWAVGNDGLLSSYYPITYSGSYDGWSVGALCNTQIG